MAEPRQCWNDTFQRTSGVTVLTERTLTTSWSGKVIVARTSQSRFAFKTWR
jgi:RNA polymerase subunit RPABC4/transcription elongation factor Spt4